MQLYRDNSPITTRSYWLGKDGWESKEVALYEYLCKKVNSVCEVGGNIGLFTVFGAGSNKAIKYTVYEPVPYNFDLLQKHTELNGINFVKVNKCCCSWG